MDKWYLYIFWKKNNQIVEINEISKIVKESAEVNFNNSFSHLR